MANRQWRDVCAFYIAPSPIGGTLGPRSFYSMDGRDLLSYMDANDDYHPIAVMTPSGLRVVELSNDDDGYVGWVWPSTDPESYKLVTQGSSLVLLTPSERLMANDPPYLIAPVMIPRTGPGVAAHDYDIKTYVVNSDVELLAPFERVLPAVDNNYVPIYEP